MAQQPILRLQACGRDLRSTLVKSLQSVGQDLPYLRRGADQSLIDLGEEVLP